MVIEDQIKKVNRALLKRPLTAKELAVRAGFPHGRSLNRALSAMKRTGEIAVVAGRPTKYTKVA